MPGVQPVRPSPNAQVRSATSQPENVAPDLRISSALGGTRTPNLLIRSQMLYPLSYERTNQQYTAGRTLTMRALC